MSIALLGLVVLQAYWIKHDFDLKEKQFDQMVTSSLDATVNKLDMEETFKMMSQAGLINANSFAGMIDSSLAWGVTYEDENDSVALKVTDTLGAKQRYGEGMQMVMEEVKDGKKIKKIIQAYDSTFISKDQSLKINDKRIQSIIQTEPVLANVEDQYKYKVQNKLDKVNELLLRINKKMKQEPKQVAQRIDLKKLEKTLNEELLNKGIDLNYNFGIVASKDSSLVYVKNKKHNGDIKTSKYRVELSPDDLFMNADILVVTFPGKINFLIANIWPLIMFSCLFTLIIILGVAYTVHVVFRQKKLAEIKNDFINNMTHEFKTPIATIGIATDTLKNPKVFGNKEKLDFYTGIIKQENERMNNQVNKVLQMAQIDKGELTFKYDEVDVVAIINKVVNGVQLQLQEKQGTITITNQAISTTINADSTHFANVINNLIDNALKYSPEKPVIKIKLWNENDALAICVSDNGIGMNEETQKRIFETFYRAPTGNIHNVKGFGLGLSYVKAIIDDMKGEIEVKSEPGKGSTFIVTLPLLIPKKTDKEQELINA